MVFFVLWVVASWFCSAMVLALFFEVLLVCGFLGETSSSKNIITAKTENKIIKNHLTVLDRFILPVKVSAIDDVKKLAKLGIYGAIIGKAYYTGAIKLDEAIEVTK